MSQKITAPQIENYVQQHLERCTKELARVKESYLEQQISASEYGSCCRSLEQAIKELGAIRDF